MTDAHAAPINGSMVVDYDGRLLAQAEPAAIRERIAAAQSRPTTPLTEGVS